MTPADLDLTYTRLSQALGRAGEPQAARLLAILALSLIARESDAAPVAALIEQAETLVREHP